MNRNQIHRHAKPHKGHYYFLSKKVLDGKAFFAYNGYAIFQSEEVYLHENDFPAQEEIQIQGSRFPCKNEQCRREERFLLPEEQKEENSFQHRPQQCGLFFYRLSSYYIRRRDGAICFIEKER